MNGHHVFDGFQEAYDWFSHNVNENDKVIECSKTFHFVIEII
jgi:hypothetical protein